MATVVVDDDPVIIPRWVTDLGSFRSWLETDPLPEKARTWFLAGEVWVDMSKEQLFTHLLLKGEFYRVLGSIVRDGKLGWLYPDGLLLTNAVADLSGYPDGTFVSRATITAGLAVLVPGKDGGFVEITGTPDLVLEVVSDGSETKDSVTLLDAYFAAGIPEYWLADARGAELEFTIYARGPVAYLKSADRQGWVRSTVSGKEFRRTRDSDPEGNFEFTLEVR